MIIYTLGRSDGEVVSSWDIITLPSLRCKIILKAGVKEVRIYSHSSFCAMEAGSLFLGVWLCL